MRLKHFGCSIHLGGTGYSDGGTYALPTYQLKNKLGSGVGATAGITIENGSVSRCHLH